ncbi:hypothetical protein WN48_01128 [Eufriesea mexicana]|nr:hypothetical protein WN48_01128 [Eufriesea mexicana]
MKHEYGEVTESPLWRILPELRIIPIGAYPLGCSSFGSASMEGGKLEFYYTVQTGL